MKVKTRWKTRTPIGSFIPGLRKRSAEKSRDLAIRVFNGAVDRTPVRSGALRASWSVSEGSPVYKDAPVADGVTLPRPVAPNLPAQPKLLGNRYYVTNGKSYANYVENGSPTTQPAKMLERAVRAAVR